VVREYREALARARPGAEPAVLELDSFVSAKILVEGLRRAGRGATRAGLIAALESLGRYDTGGYAVTYTRDNHNGSTFVDMAIVGANGKLQY
jgi:ABC-type branched-subunit amino acid transport system substrate-binding protein